ncbi:hypothetical protein ACS0TY_011251 [Phlomoides rotata]
MLLVLFIPFQFHVLPSFLSDAALVMLSGQIADGSTTIFAGELVANLSMYAVAFVVFNVNTKVSIIDVENQYRWIAYASIFIGCCFVGVFHLGTADPSLKREAHEKGCHVFLFVFAVVDQSFLAFYVINDLQMAQFSKALVPVVIYICSFIISILLQVALKPKFIEVQRSKIFYSAGGLLWIISGTGILFLPSSIKAFMYVLWGCKCLDNGKVKIYLL